MEPPKLSPPIILAGCVLTLWLVNYGLVQLGQAPWVYCVAMMAAPWFEGYMQAVRLILLVWFVYSVWRRGLFGGIFAGAVIVAVYGLPVFMATLWGLGAEALCL